MLYAYLRSEGINPCDRASNLSSVSYKKVSLIPPNEQNEGMIFKILARRILYNFLSRREMQELQLQFILVLKCISEKMLKQTRHAGQNGQTRQNRQNKIIFKNDQNIQNLRKIATVYEK